MTILLEIPDSVARAMRLPPKDQRQQLKVELALSLYAQSILTHWHGRRPSPSVVSQAEKPSGVDQDH